jgi:hypothetical protein
MLGSIRWIIIYESLSLHHRRVYYSQFLSHSITNVLIRRTIVHNFISSFIYIARMASASFIELSWAMDTICFTGHLWSKLLSNSNYLPSMPTALLACFKTFFVDDLYPPHLSIRTKRMSPVGRDSLA